LHAVRDLARLERDTAALQLRLARAVRERGTRAERRGKD